MTTPRRPFALLSVHDKSGLVDFARALTEHFDLLASGGTARVLSEAGLEVLLVENLTGFPELLGGRVKTLHPAIHAGLLSRRNEADRAELARHALPEIGLVAVSLYPFEKAVEDPTRSEAECIEEIDIGGVALLRAAAKNHAHVWVVPGPEHYALTLSALSGAIPVPHARSHLAAVTMQRTASYDLAIARWLSSRAESANDSASPLDESTHTPTSPPDASRTSTVATSDSPPAPADTPTDPAAALARPFSGHRISQALRYGENPHQDAVFLERPGHSAYRQLSGKELSYNNLLDLDAAWSAVCDFSTPTCVVVKHGSPCGIASVAPSPSQAHATTAPGPSQAHATTATTAPGPSVSHPELVQKAIAADPVSAFGGILVVNFPLDLPSAEALGDLFLEICAAPSVTPEAAAFLARTKKNCRVLVMTAASPGPVVRSALGGLLVQTPDTATPTPDLFKAVTNFAPLDLDLCAFAWSTVKHLKSNAIAVCLRDGESLVTAGLGAGQTNRIDATRQALDRAHLRYTELPNRNPVLASDAFFPFSDGLEAAAASGVKIVLQPGGALRDQEVIDTANRLGVTLAMTGRRHFRH